MSLFQGMYFPTKFFADSVKLTYVVVFVKNVYNSNELQEAFLILQFFRHDPSLIIPNISN